MFAKLFSDFKGKRDRYDSSPPPDGSQLPYRLEDVLPQAVEDRLIREKLYEIFERIEEHVEAFYTPDNSMTKSQQLNANHRGTAMMEMSREHDTSQAGVQTRSSEHSHLDEKSLKLWMMERLARLLITTVSPYENDEDAGTLLPEELRCFLTAIEEPERRARDACYPYIFGQWKAISAYLLNHPCVREENIKENDRRLQKEYRYIQDQVDHEFDSLYDPQDERRPRHLRQIVEQTADFGELLWSQVAHYRFDWDLEASRGKVANIDGTSRPSRRRKRHRENRSGRRRSPVKGPPTVYMPGLTKMTDHRGQMLDPVVCVLEPRKAILTIPSKWPNIEAVTSKNLST